MLSELRFLFRNAIVVVCFPCVLELEIVKNFLACGGLFVSNLYRSYYG